MPHVSVEDVMAATGSGEESISVVIEEVSPSEWKEKVYKPEIVNHRGTLYKPPGYSM